MNLDEAQRKKIGEWIGQGLKLSEIQNRLISELGLQLTYMEVRMLVDDLRLVPKDIERPKSPPVGLGAATSEVAKQKQSSESQSPAPAAGLSSGVSLSVDQITRPGSLVSGKVSFSDGNIADWYLDQTGRLALMPKQAGYRPPASDVQQFQAALESELSKLGL